jgi:hypothetical protein
MNCTLPHEEPKRKLPTEPKLRVEPLVYSTIVWSDELPWMEIPLL